MAFDFGTFVVVGDILVQTHSDLRRAEEHWTNCTDARYRSAVSRLYYGVFKYAYTYILRHEDDADVLMSEATLCEHADLLDKATAYRAKAVTVDGKRDINKLHDDARSLNIHGHVIRKVRNSVSNEAGEALKILRDLRNAADYNPFLRFTKATVAIAKDEQKRVVLPIKQLFESKEAR